MGAACEPHQEGVMTMSTSVLLRVKGDPATYHVDLGAGSVSRIEACAEVQPLAGREFHGVELAVASESREATATFPAFTD